jgi:cell division septation protein DedD
MLGGNILMKTIFRVSVLGLLITAFSAVSALAQDPCADSYETKQAIYGPFREKRKAFLAKITDIESGKAAIKYGEEFVSKYGACAADEAVVKFVKEKLPELKTGVAEQELYIRFNTAVKDVKTVNPAEAFASGKEIIALKGDSTISLDVALALAAIGYDNANKATPDYKFNSDTINYAKQAIQKLEAGKTTESYGAWSYIFAVRDAQKKVDHVKSKANALAWMNYTIGTTMYYGQKQEKDALPYLYKATQFDSEIKNRPALYQAIGAWYLAELLKIDEKRLALITQNADKDTDETLAMLALEKGYAERSMDAYARAHKLAKADTKSAATYVTSLYEKIQGLYKLRFDKTDGLDVYLSTLMSKPLPDPTSAVTPVVETPTTTTSTTTNPSTTTPATTTKPATTTTTKPTDSTTKPTTTPTKPAATTGTKTSTTKPKVNAKAKKKGTR